MASLKPTPISKMGAWCSVGRLKCQIRLNRVSSDNFCTSHVAGDIFSRQVWVKILYSKVMRIILLLRSLIMSPLVGLYTLFVSAACIVQNLILNSRVADNFMIRWVWSKPVMFAAGVKIEKRGDESQLKGGGLYLFNHSSHLDILVIFSTLNPPPRFGAKIELFKVPLFGWAMRRVGTLPIARDNKEEVLKVYREASVRFAGGERFALAPEGTRQEVRKIGKFKTGPFIFAINAQCPIIPVVMAGVMDLMPKKSLLINPEAWVKRVILEIGPAISTEGYTLERLRELQEKTHQQMTETFTRLNQELGLAVSE